MPSIDVKSQQISGLISTARKLSNPHRPLTDVEIRPAGRAAAAPAVAPPIEMTEVAVNQDTAINADAYLPGVELCGQSLTETLGAIKVLTGGHPLATKAYNEQKAIGA